MVKHDTLPKINIAPENRPSQKESRLPTTNFQRLCQFQGGYPRWWFQTSFLLKSRKNGKMIQLDLQLRVVFQLGGFNHHLVIQPEERTECVPPVWISYGPKNWSTLSTFLLLLIVFSLEWLGLTCFFSFFFGGKGLYQAVILMTSFPKKVRS